ncbi:unnamed protein product [Owenia fusiformis]|uniref:Cytochrome P450 n=1 Tax=Owenia fusiformis TaxID=6347 RepID=A0A8S4N1L9_OWEFU|nr:unnamed protein product [Owenia fusiformis]
MSVVLKLAIVLFIALPGVTSIYKYAYNAGSDDENNDGVPDSLDLNRDGKLDHPGCPHNKAAPVLNPALLQTRDEPYRDLANTSASLLQGNLGIRPLLILNQYDVQYEAFVHQIRTYGDRPFDYLTNEVQGQRGFFNLPFGQTWKSYRQIIMRYYSNNVIRQPIGFEQSIKAELDYLRGILKTGAKLDISQVLARPLLRNFFFMIFGTSFTDFTDDIDKKIIPLFVTSLTLRPKVIDADWEPKKRETEPVKLYIENTKKILSVLKTMIQAHFMKKPNGIGNALADKLRKNIQQRLEAKGEDTCTFDELTAVIWDLLQLTVPGIIRNLNWYFLYMLNYPAVQSKVQSEIDQYLKGRAANGQDQLNHILPYTEGSILEVLRISPHTAIKRRTNAPSCLHGYNIPSNITVVPNLWKVSNDPHLWEKPEEYRPERFQDGIRFGTPAAFVPFSIGLRRCPGEAVAKMWMFLYVTPLLQEFKFIPEAIDGSPPPLESLPRRLFDLITPVPYKLIAQMR